MSEHSFNVNFTPKHKVKEWKLPKNTSYKKYAKIHPEKNVEKRVDIILPLIQVTCSNIKRNELLLPLRKYVNERVKAVKTAHNRVPLRNKYKIEANDAYLRRFIHNPTDNIITVLHKDEYFFKIVDGRPIAHHIPLYKTYQDIYQKIVLFKQEAGYRKDHILNMEFKHARELDLLHRSIKMCKNQAKNFDGFISEDYFKSMRLLRDSDGVRFNLHQLSVEYRHLSAHTGYIRSRILALSDKFTLQKRYQRFLNALAPPSWRSAHHFTDVALSCADATEADDTFSVTYERVQSELQRPSTGAHGLYFTEPDEVVEIYQFVENRNFAYLEHVTRMSRAARRLHEVARDVREAIVYEHSLVEGVIRELTRLIDSEHAREQSLKASFFRILNGSLYECLASTDALKLLTSLEYCFERISGCTAINMNLFALAKYLEDFDLECHEIIDGLSGDVMRRAVVDSTAADRRCLKRAERARKELRQFDRLSRRLQRACSPPVKWRPPEHKRRLAPRRDKLSRATAAAAAIVSTAETKDNASS